MKHHEIVLFFFNIISSDKLRKFQFSRLLIVRLPKSRTMKRRKLILLSLFLSICSRLEFQFRSHRIENISPTKWQLELISNIRMMNSAICRCGNKLITIREGESGLREGSGKVLFATESMYRVRHSLIFCLVQAEAISRILPAMIASNAISEIGRLQ